MSIPALTIYEQLNALLAAEGANYYDVNLDIIPAINRAQKYIVSIINSVLGSKKFSEEYYRELVKVLIFQTSQYSRVDLTPIQPYVMWDILDILVNPTLDVPFVPVAVANGLSAPLPLRFYVKDGTSCERATVAEWNTNKKNPFAGGYALEPKGQNLKPAYLGFADYFNGIFPVPNEIEISPAVPVQPVAVYFVKLPSDIKALSDNLEFPSIFTDIMTKAAFREISIKQGDGSTAIGVATQDIQTYIRSLA